MKIKNTMISLLGLTAATALVYAEEPAPVITTQPQSQTVREGESVTFSVIAESGNEGFTGGENFTTPISSSVNLDMIWIEPGTFTMGCPEDELGRFVSDQPQHSVTICDGFWIGKYEVTQAQYEAIKGNNPSYFSGDNNPVESITYYSAIDFCRKLTERERVRLPKGYEYTLPTEAQWEYACRAGVTTAFNNGTNIPTEEQCQDKPCPNLDPIAWYSYNSDKTTHPVGQKLPNAWGLYDMHGNVEEWCLNWYDNGGAKGPVIRGGTWGNDARHCRTAVRLYTYADSFPTGGYLGFRVALCRTEDILTYQWYKDGTAISGATSSSYTIENVKASDAGSYTVTVNHMRSYDVVSKTSSDAAVLTVETTPLPEGMSVQREVNVSGNSATVTMTISNAPKVYSSTLEENWQSKILTFSGISNGGTVAETEEGMKVSWSGSNAEGNYQIPGTLTYTVSVPEGTSATVVLSGKLAITTSNGIVRADIAAENVTFTPSVLIITTQPQSQTVNEGESVTFSVIAESVSSEGYQVGKNFTTPISSTVNLDMIWINPGTFTMGSSLDTDLVRNYDETLHEVTLTQGYWLGKYEV